MKKLILIALSAGLSLSLAACNTIAGAGKDIERAGEKIQNAVKK